MRKRRVILSVLLVLIIGLSTFLVVYKKNENINKEVSKSIGLVSKDIYSYRIENIYKDYLLIKKDGKYALSNKKGNIISNYYVGINNILVFDKCIVLEDYNSELYYVLDKDGKEKKIIKGRSIEEIHDKVNYKSYYIVNDRIYNEDFKEVYKNEELYMYNVVVFDDKLYIDIGDKVIIRDLFGNEEVKDYQLKSYKYGSYESFNINGVIYLEKDKKLTQYNDSYYIGNMNVFDDLVIDDDGNTYEFISDTVFKSSSGLIFDYSDNIVIKKGDKEIVLNEEDEYSIVNDSLVIRYEDDETVEVNVYDLELNKIDNVCNDKDLLFDYKLGKYVCKNFKDEYYFSDDKEVFNNYECNDKVCILKSNEKYKLISENKTLIDYSPYYNMKVSNDEVYISTYDSTNVYKIEENSKEEVKYIVDNYNIDVDKLIEEYNLDKNIINNNKELFKKYAYIVENNYGVKDYKSYMYNLFKVIVDNKKYLDESYFFRGLDNLYIYVVNNLNSSGLYDGKNIFLYEGYSDTIVYHELMHFVDDRIGPSRGIIYSCDDLKKYTGKTDKYCEIVNTLTFLTESGAETYSSSYFNNDYGEAYPNIVQILEIFKYIYGEDVMQDIFFNPDSEIEFYKLLVERTGISLDNYRDFVYNINDINNFDTSNEEDENEKIYYKVIEILLKIYEKEKKANWEDDEVFKYMIGYVLNIDQNTELYKKLENYTDLYEIHIERDDIATYSQAYLKVINREMYWIMEVELRSFVKKNLLVKYDFKNKKVISYELLDSIN